MRGAQEKHGSIRADSVQIEISQIATSKLEHGFEASIPEYKDSAFETEGFAILKQFAKRVEGLYESAQEEKARQRYFEIYLSAEERIKHWDEIMAQLSEKRSLIASRLDGGAIFELKMDIERLEYKLSEIMVMAEAIDEEIRFSLREGTTYDIPRKETAQESILRDLISDAKDTADKSQIKGERQEEIGRKKALVIEAEGRLEEWLEISAKLDKDLQDSDIKMDEERISGMESRMDSIVIEACDQKRLELSRELAKSILGFDSFHAISLESSRNVRYDGHPYIPFMSDKSKVVIEITPGAFKDILEALQIIVNKAIGEILNSKSLREEGVSSACFAFIMEDKELLNSNEIKVINKIKKALKENKMPLTCQDNSVEIDSRGYAQIGFEKVCDQVAMIPSASVRNLQVDRVISSQARSAGL